MNKFRITLLFLLALPALIKAQTSLFYKYYDMEGYDALTSHGKIIFSADKKYYYVAFAQVDSIDSVNYNNENGIVYSKLDLNGNIINQSGRVVSPIVKQ